MDHPSRLGYLPFETCFSLLLFLVKFLGQTLDLSCRSISMPIYICMWRCKMACWYPLLMIDEIYVCIHVTCVPLKREHIGYILGGANGCRSCVTFCHAAVITTSFPITTHFLPLLPTNGTARLDGERLKKKRFVRCACVYYTPALGCKVICDRVSCGFLATFIPYRCAPANG